MLHRDLQDLSAAMDVTFFFIEKTQPGSDYIPALDPRNMKKIPSEGFAHHKRIYIIC